MRLSNLALTGVAAAIAPLLSEMTRTTGMLTVDDVRDALRQARDRGIQVPAIQSDRSVRLVAEAYIEGY